MFPHKMSFRSRLASLPLALAAGLYFARRRAPPPGHNPQYLYRLICESLRSLGIQALSELRITTNRVLDPQFCVPDRKGWLPSGM